MNINERAKRILATQGFMQFHSVKLPGVRQNGGLTQTSTSTSVTRYERSQSEHSCVVRQWREPWFYKFHCVCGVPLWRACNNCKTRYNETHAEREAKLASATRSM